ncbi:hypothetical protein P280DRAFT_507332 [Massarina eburnea CBS 473.64]|uniref:Velvet domain-containing protein n=1 Tax=Massarina eburnea CBS 473.64 TaxID=1395130 RepID=A0A6A6S040_9PLEO|nr:hypothetical protein P280DRAFT_507332 [Massarina eburnea CBS 473.64]
MGSCACQRAGYWLPREEMPVRRAVTGDRKGQAARWRLVDSSTNSRPANVCADLPGPGDYCCTCVPQKHTALLAMGAMLSVRVAGDVRGHVRGTLPCSSAVRSASTTTTTTTTTATTTTTTTSHSHSHSLRPNFDGRECSDSLDAVESFSVALSCHPQRRPGRVPTLNAPRARAPYSRGPRSRSTEPAISASVARTSQILFLFPSILSLPCVCASQFVCSSTHSNPLQHTQSAMASIIPVANETKSSSIRTTKDGRQIRYALQVIQQPERARACGSGAKSSADRRPVDPPPIVELRIFEGEQEITFAYNANFFLFATLENARTMAPGRAPASAASFPVLTGTPVAGMAYLDRPSPAGYFIFPDLSVRHEGKYRLSFALYEELKDSKDMDPEDRAGQPGSEGHVSHRLEVKSSPFIVFSAKKFPGLSESTALSRMVAEQGCRVRIRRDVRMRRRENKANKDWDEFDEEGAYEQARRTATPDAYNQQPGMPTPNQGIDPDRPRSVSNASNGSYAPPRRPSMDEMPQSYQQPPPPNNYQQMHPPQSAAYPQMPQYASSQGQYQGQYAPQPAASTMHPPQAPYTHTAHPSQPPTHTSYQSQPSMGYYQQPHYEQPAPVRQEPPVDYSQPATDYRRSSVTQPPQQYPGPNQLIPPYSPMDYNRSQPMPQPYQTPSHSSPPGVMGMTNGNALAPLKALQPLAPEQRLEPVSPPIAMSAPMSATSEHPPRNNYMDSRASISGYAPQPQPQSTLGQKRSYSSTFDTTHINDRLQQGARPNTAAAGSYGYDDADMEEPMDRTAMSYRRADGSHRQRRVPELNT